MDAIPEQWIKEYVDKMLAIAQRFPEAGKMREATLLRADAVMDMVRAYRESKSNQPKRG